MRILTFPCFFIRQNIAGDSGHDRKGHASEEPLVVKNPSHTKPYRDVGDQDLTRIPPKKDSESSMEE